MFYRIAPITPLQNSTDFVSLETMKMWLKVDDSEDAFLIDLLDEAMGIVENICDQPIFERNYRVTLSGFASGRFPVLVLPESPAISATYTRTGYTDAFSIQPSELVLSGSRISFAQSLTSVSGITGVTLTAKLGYSAQMLPGGIKTALRYIVTKMYENRIDGPDTYRLTSERLLTKYIRYGS